VPFVDDEGLDAKAAEVSGPIDLLLGRRNYEIFLRVLADRRRIGDRQAVPRRHEVRGLTEPALARLGPAVLIEDAAERVAALKAEDGPELQVHGSGNLAQTLIRHGLVDEYHLWFFPIVLGEGKRLFAEGTIPATLRLVDSKVSPTGVFMGTYVPAGEVVTGSFE
jgi:dihydrofolate reductase